MIIVINCEFKFNGPVERRTRKEKVQILWMTKGKGGYESLKFNVGKSRAEKDGEEEGL